MNLNSIKIKAIGGALVIGIFMVCGMLFLMRFQLNAFFLSEYEQEIENIALGIADEIKSAVIQREGAEISAYLEKNVNERFAKNSRIEYLYVGDGSGNVIADSFKGNFPLYIKEKRNIIPPGKLKSFKALPYVQKDGPDMDFAFRIPGGAGEVLHLGICKCEFNDHLKGFIPRLLFLFSFMLLVGSFLAGVLIMFLLKPINNLIKVINEIGKGNYKVRADASTKDEIGLLAKTFNSMMEDIEAKENTSRKITQILHLSLDDTLFDEFLRRALMIMLDTPWLGIENKGSIYMVEGNGSVLIMRAQHNLPDEILDKCYKVSFGECICGQAAATKQMQFVSRLDQRHKQLTSKEEHGHFCIPLIYAGGLLGVLNLYTKDGHLFNKKEENFFKQAGEALAVVIKRKQAEDALEFAYLELRETQSRLIQAEKMQVVGRMASGIAHEVKNPLAIMLTGVEYLRIVLNDRKDLIDTLVQMEEAIRRADNVVRGLLDFAKSSRLEIATERFNSLVYNSLILVNKHLEQRKIRLVSDFTTEDPAVEVDINKMDEVFLNLLMNAVQAMPDGGVLSVKTYVKKLSEYGYGVGRRMSDIFKIGEKIAVAEIEDTGSGIPEEKIDRIFEPFFTTRRTEGGSGLGLSIAKSIIDMHNGLIDLRNKEDGKGAMVAVALKVKESV